MAVSYKKLWKLLIDHDMKKRDLEKAESLFRNLTLLVEKLRGSYEKKKGFNV